MLRLSWLISMGISLFGVMLIQYFFKLKPEETAEVGNLGALGLALVIPFLILSIFITYRFFVESARHAHDQLMRMIYLIFGVALLVAFIYYANDFKNEVYTSLGGNTKTLGSQIYGFPVLNEYTNHVFVNFYTFGIIHTISGLIGALVGIIKPSKKDLIESEETEQ
ncbi:nucleoside-diphosphate sugar epimerase [Lysinibacillus sp. 2017]|uniref:nucleoside-diphosphate sugar epimerase n=1 Tax=unclassified Lysinibacillus TaxID=2636778 RepID=UPI000D526676|nr:MULTISPECIES: nucleoside-diphosphate sugar epimerase [unclassified Lysinibacillus]AWE08277.1 nucleoside-diphosphate sugar epimerase [Lysinibacillus sp. 2017]TGN36220.1 nucleoside-diphosphate sugar epimerase [Lysinibacillus sp. S2017]